MDIPSCCICLENNFNKSTRNRSTCIYCNISYCRACLKEYVKQIESDFKCANCSKSWNDDHIYAMLPKTFVDVEARGMRTKIILEQEKQLLPATMELAMNYKKHKEELAVSKQLIIDIKTILTHTEEPREKKELNSILRQTYEVIRGIDREIRHILASLEEGEIDQEEGEKSDEKEHFFKVCPVETCNGYLSTRWKCGICGIKVCKDCLEIKKDSDYDHNCKEDDIKSALEVKQSCKDCPKCKSKIFRVSGCPQMWCTKCHTTFDWNTGRISKGVIHNPEYFQWLKKRSNNLIIGENCGADVTYEQLLAEIKSRNMEEVGQKILDIFRKVAEINDIDRRTYEPPNREEKNRKHRILFLNNEIDEKEFARQLFLTDVKYRKNMEITEIMNMITEASNIIFRRFIDHEVFDVIFEFEELETLVTNQAKIINSRYKHGGRFTLSIVGKAQAAINDIVRQDLSLDRDLIDLKD